MNITQLAEHSVSLDLLPIEPVVLDVGCRGFDFAAAVVEARPKARVFCMDPDISVALDPRAKLYAGCMPVALVGDERDTVGYMNWHDGFGNFILPAAAKWFNETAQAHGAEMLIVRAKNLRAISNECGITRWDLVKLDCEGAEFGILASWPGAIAAQISVEFHDYMHRTHYDAAYFADLLAALPWYQVVQHEDFVACDNAMGHWDSLLVLKKEYR